MKKLIAVFLCLALLSLSAFAETEMSVKLEDYLSRIDDEIFDDMREEWDDLDEDLLEYSQDHSEALRICYEKAEQGDANAQRIVGEMYYAAYVVERDFDKAYEWVMKAVEQGDAEAQSQIDYSTDENLSIALDEISTTGIDLQPTETCELVEFYYPTDSQDSHFLLRVQLSKNEYSSIVLQLQSSDRYQLIEATEDGLRGITGNTKYFEYRYGIKFNEVTDIYRAWTAGKRRFTVVTLFIFTCANNECILTILRY